MKSTLLKRYADTCKLCLGMDLYSCNMGTSSFLEIYILKVTLGLWEYISQVPMLQLLCNTSKADILDANTTVTTGSLIYAWLKDLIMVRQQ